MPIANRLRIVGGVLVGTLALGGTYAGDVPPAPMHLSDVTLSASEHRTAEDFELLDVEEVRLRLTRLDGAMQGAQYRAAALLAIAEAPALKAALELAQFLLGRLRAGWYASGLWSSEAVAAQDASEVESVEDELFFRLHAIERAARLRAGELSPPDADRLDLLGDTLRAVRH